MAQVMTESGNGYALNIALSNPKLRLLFPEVLWYSHCQVSRANTVLEPPMISSLKNVLVCAELVKVP